MPAKKSKCISRDKPCDLEPYTLCRTHRPIIASMESDNIKIRVPRPSLKDGFTLIIPRPFKDWKKDGSHGVKIIHPHKDKEQEDFEHEIITFPLLKQIKRVYDTTEVFQ